MRKIFIFWATLATAFSVQAQQVINMTPGFKNELFLSKGQQNIYVIRLNKGDFLNMAVLQEGVDIVIDVFDPKGQKLKSIDSPNGRRGVEPVNIEALFAGLYRLEVHPFNDPNGLSESDFTRMTEENQGNYAIKSVEILSAKEFRQKLAEENQNAKNVIRWLTDNTITFDSVSAGNGFVDLQPLKQILKDVKYVGLGEATHGTREFFQMKHRMLEFLVKEMDFNVFAIEASYAGCKNINDYVIYGKGDAYTALASQGFWTWDTEEVIDLIEWMRKYNQSVTDQKKIKFAGFDIQVNTEGGGIRKIKEYLQKVDTMRFIELNSFLDSIEYKTNSSKKDSLINVYNNFLSFFTMSKGHYVLKSSVQEYENALEYCRVLGQFIDVYFMNENDPGKKEREWRDYYMANDFFNMVEHENPETKVVIWAHNGHISHNPTGFINGGFKPFGSYLKEAYGDQYYAFGFKFNKGGFQAMEMDSTGKFLGLKEFITKPAKEKSLDWHFAQTNKPGLIFNLRNNNLPDFMNEFVNKPTGTRGFGAGADRRFIDQSFEEAILSADFDGIIFINETHRARPTKKENR